MDKSFLNPWRGLKDLPREMWALFITTLINRSGTMVIPFLTLYLTQEIKVTPARAGTALLVYGVGAFISSPFTGKLADKTGPLRVMKYSLFGTGLMYAVFSLSENYYLILLFSFLLSVINEAFRPANLSMITEIAAPSQRRIAFALNRLAINTGMSIGPVVGGFLTLVDYKLLFYANALTSAAAGVYLHYTGWLTIPDKNPEHSMQDSRAVHKLVSGKSVLKDKSYLFFLAAIIPVNLVFFQILGALPLYIVEELRYSTASYGLLLAINTVLIIIAEIPLNNMMGNISYRNSLFAGAILTAVGFGATGLARDTFPLMITIVIWTFGEMIFFPVSAAYASDAAPPAKRGEYMGYYQMIFSFAFLAGPWLGTVVYQNFSSWILWTATFVLGMITALLMIRIRTVPQHQNPPESFNDPAPGSL